MLVEIKFVKMLSGAYTTSWFYRW